MKESQLFKRLLTELNVPKLATDTQVFVLLPRQGCFGCMQRTLLNLRGVKNDEVTFLISNRNKNVLRALDKNSSVYYDTLGYMDRLDFKMAGAKFIKTDFKEYYKNARIHHDSVNLMRRFIQHDD